MCNVVDRQLRKFWWGTNDSGNPKLHLRAWDHICKPKTVGGLGFRRTSDYNRAFLARWSWLLTSGSTALWAQVLRNKYLRIGTFLDAEARASDSAFWKALLGVKDLIHKGACYLVGNGSSINIWRDPWVPKHQAYRPTPTCEPGPGFAWVNDFIMPGQRWNSVKLGEAFCDEDVQRILQIPLSVTTIEDKWGWMAAKNSKFSVKSAYIVDQKQRFSLPSSIALLSTINKKIPLERTSCPLCGGEEETPYHLFFRCPHVQPLWFMSPWTLRMENFSTSTCAQFLEFLLTGVEAEVSSRMLLYFSCLIEQTWKIRNELVHESKNFNLMWLHNRISAQYRELVAECNDHRKPRTTQEQWLPPPDGWLKVNTDVCMREKGSVGVSMVRDSRGTVVLAGSNFFHFEDVLVAESAALLAGIRLTIDNGFTNVIFEVDCDAVAKAIHGSMDDLTWEARTVLSDCKNLLQQLDMWEVDWIPRSANASAHNLAKWCSQSNVSGLIPFCNSPFSLCTRDRTSL
ncbi:Ribonuclease H-like domain containing protein [Trema orientale]|uniref:Ribonuclease H-like domain containing protein n=1 Tax=Trema orientale TaxID=63057 RepID=A0A2P5CEC8_TREOI|nr:Ribonuclease H-like domain containing protein [Trema orientale]